MWPRFDRDEQRTLLGRALPVAAALALGQVYFRLVILLMSLISIARQTGYFGGSLRAMESLIYIPILVAGVALPLLAAAARDDRERLRYAIEGLGEGAVIAGVLVVLVTVRAAEPVMAIIGGPSSARPGAVLRIQVGALLFIALYQIWTVVADRARPSAGSDPHQRHRPLRHGRLRRRAGPAASALRAERRRACSATPCWPA